MRKSVVLLALLMMAPGSAWAGTNFPTLKDYPAPDCVKPGDKPVMAMAEPRQVPAGGSLTLSTGTPNVKDYNERVAAYNTALQAYTRCMDAYVDNAQADMNAIRDKVTQAVAAGRVP
jgi:hypothetical protein